jgi:hypothetical protein
MGKRATVLAIIATDVTFARAEWRGREVWAGKCIHCGGHLHVELDGRPISRATIEHIVPRHHGGTDALENVALACARCNGGKGTRLDALSRSDPRLVAVIETLQARRRERWRAGAEEEAMEQVPPLLVVDAANVVGSVPDGWWHDRRGATERVRDGLVAVAAEGLLRGPEVLRRPPVEVVLVVEGRARGVASVEGVEVVAASGSGDDAIVAVVAERGAGRWCGVATADRGLIARVTALGAEVIGPRSVR